MLHPSARQILARLCLASLLLGPMVRPLAAAAVSVPDLLDAKVQYTAAFYLDVAGQGSYHGSVVHAPGRERREFDTHQGHQALLLRRDIDEATMMWPERKWYLTTSFTAVAQLVGGFDGLTLDRRKTGTEVVGGETCTRFEVTGAQSQGGEGDFEGRMWFTRDGILMKAVGTVRFSGRDTRIETGLSSLRRINADPAAFTPPSDYKGMPLDFSKFGLR